tara:strand:+ start:766 stop:1926 length:1161 start_codon:yes stop_codon:yes gene_type:complete
MNIRSTLIVFLFALCANADGQDVTTDEVESKARGLLSDPRLKNMLRSVKEDPEGTTKAVEEGADTAVREATRMFQENPDIIKESAAKIPTDEESIKTTATSAMSQLTRMLPAPAPSSSNEVPATRSANKAQTAIATPVATPLATATEGELPPPPATVAAETIIQDRMVEPLPSTEPTAPQIPDSPLLSGSDVPAPEPLVPHYKANSSGNYQAAERNDMVITSRESIMDNGARLITFLGNVVINHPELEIKCEKLVIELADEGAKKSEGGGSFKRAIASGGMVEIRRVSPEGKTQIALARRADYNGVTKEIVLSGGPPYLQDGDRYVRTHSEDSQIIMTGDGKYQVTGSDTGVKSRNTISIPIDSDGDSKNIGIGNSLGGSIDRLNE